MRFARLILLFTGVTFFLQCAGQRSMAQNAPPAATEAGADVGPPKHPATEDQIREYMALTGVSRTVHTLMAKTVDAMQLSAAPYYPASYWTDMSAEFQKLDFVSICVPIYQKFLSQEDMTEIIAFYRSPAGKRILASQGPIIQEAQVVMQKAGGEIGQRVYAKHAEEIEAAKAKYDAGQGQKTSPEK